MEQPAEIQSKPRRQYINTRARSAKDANKPLPDISTEQFCHLYAETRNASKSGLAAFPNLTPYSAAKKGSELLKNDLVLQRIQAIVKPVSKRFSQDEIRAEFRHIYDNSKSEHARIRILEDLAKIEGMFIEKNVNLNANVDATKLPDLSSVPLPQLEQEFIRRMKLENAGVETFKQLSSPISDPGANTGIAQSMDSTAHGSEQAEAQDIEQGGGGVCPSPGGGGDQ